MIKIIDKDFKQLNEFKSFCETDSFGTRIYSHYLTYSTDFNFTDFWVQLVDDSIVCAVCRLDADFIVCASDYTDFEELSAFLNFQNTQTITFDNSYFEKLNLQHDKITTGDILKYCKKCDKTNNFVVIQPDNKRYYDLLLSCKSEDFYVPDYHSFLSDVGRRQQRNLCTVYGVEADDELASCAMTVAYTDFSVILGAVATHPKYRKRGFASFIVSILANKFLDYGSVYIYTTITKNTEFYKGIGFEVCGCWCKIYGG